MPSFHPINTLPPELLGRIFIHCLPLRDSARLDPAQAPMLLCRISSHWRSVAHSEHALWDTIIFLTTDTSQAKSRRFIEQGHIDTWFARAGVDSTLVFGEEPVTRRPNRAQLTLLQDLVVAVRKYSNRFRHLSLLLSRTAHLEIVRRSLPEGQAFEELRSITLCCPAEPNSGLFLFPKFAPLTSPFTTFPKLREVNFILFRGYPMQFVLPWTRLTRVEVTNPLGELTLSAWKVIFTGCPNMEEGTFIRPTRDSVSPPEQLDPRNNTQHNALKRLVLIAHRSGEPHPSSFLQMDWEVLRGPVDFPSLKYLELVLEADRKSPGSLITYYAGTPTMGSIEALVFSAPRRDTMLVGVRDFVRVLKKSPRALVNLTKLCLPYHSSGFHDLVALLAAHPPTASPPYPGLKVVVEVLDEQWEMGNWKTTRKMTQRDPGVVKRLFLKGE